MQHIKETKRFKELKSKLNTMKNYIYINGTKIGLTDSQIKKLTATLPKQKTRPDDGAEFWVVSAYGEIVDIYYSKNLNEEWDAGDGFFTREEAVKELALRQATQRLKDYKLENFGDWKPDWTNKYQYKHFVMYSNERLKFCIDNSALYKHSHDWRYVETQEQAQQWSEDCKEAWLIYFDVK